MDPITPCRFKRAVIDAGAASLTRFHQAIAQLVQFRTKRVCQHIYSDTRASTQREKRKFNMREGEGEGMGTHQLPGRVD
jgi:hypothetical protein